MHFTSSLSCRRKKPPAHPPSSLPPRRLHDQAQAPPRPSTDTLVLLNMATAQNTTYHFALPPPKHATIHIQIRPRLILQLQQTSGVRRATPVVDVFQNSIVPSHGHDALPRSPRPVGPRDTVLLRSARYDKIAEEGGGSEDDEERLDKRHLIAILSPRKSGGAEITTEDGSTWIATPQGTKSYDFVHTDEHGITTTVRWARRSLKRRSTSQSDNEMLAYGSPPTSPPPLETTERFTFSILDPQWRRHPVIASVSSKGLNIRDHYNTTLRGPDEEEGKETHLVDDRLRNLVTVTGTWVALKEGWNRSVQVPRRVSEDRVGLPDTKVGPGPASPKTRRVRSWMGRISAG